MARGGLLVACTMFLNDYFLTINIRMVVVSCSHWFMVWPEDDIAIAIFQVFSTNLGLLIHRDSSITFCLP